jgi:sortase A
MPLYRYVKAPPASYIVRKRRPMASYGLMGLGAGVLLWVVWPILTFSLISDRVFSKIVTPVSDAQKVVNGSSLSPVAYAAAGTDSVFGSPSVDYANANMWYPTSPQKQTASQINEYQLSIPKLKIANAHVAIGGDDLSASLVHYGGTAIPGQYGNTVVFGHSALPQFFSPTNYKSIFSLLPTLKIGDEIVLHYDDIEYRYKIFEMVVLDPTDLSVLEQHFDDSYLTLVTCVPPGTYWKRLNVRAKLMTI